MWYWEINRFSAYVLALYVAAQALFSTHPPNAVWNWSSSPGGTASWSSTTRYPRIPCQHRQHEDPGPRNAAVITACAEDSGEGTYSLCRAFVEMLHSGHALHCLAKSWMTHLAAELPISTTGFPECALPRMCLDCSSRRAWRPSSRSDLLSHQIAICKHSSACSQGAPSEHRGACGLQKRHQCTPRNHLWGTREWD